MRNLYCACLPEVVKHSVSRSVMSSSLWAIDWSLPGSSVHRILQARILEWIAIFSRGSFWPRDQTRVSCIAGRYLYCLSHQVKHKPFKTLWFAFREQKLYIEYLFSRGGDIKLYVHLFLLVNIIEKRVSVCFYFFLLKEPLESRNVTLRISKELPCS